MTAISAFVQLFTTFTRTTQFDCHWSTHRRQRTDWWLPVYTTRHKLTHDCLCTGWHSTCENNQKKAKGNPDRLLLSDVLKFKRAIAPNLPISDAYLYWFFHCVKVWNHIQKFYETFFVHAIDLYISEWRLCVCWVGADVETDVASIQTHFKMGFQIL